MPKGKFIIVDGIDGSGKGQIVDFFKKFAKREGKKIFDLRLFWQQYHRFPELKEISKYQIILSAEPTFALVGRAIRQEIARDNNEHYSALSTAQAYSLDREILYKKLILPALAKGISVFQERSFTTSLIYQPVQAEPLSIKKILGLAGNKLALQNSPDLLIITLLNPKIALARLGQRQKKDKAIFEKLKILQKLDQRFRSRWFRNIFHAQKTKIIYLDTNKSLKETQKEAQTIWDSLR
ncbi:MAG: hypothetical protein WC480_01850 [Patescibacteria group bacterium]